MEEMKLLASHYGLVCLEHEKPSEHINGSGKHNNWSISANGKNLLDPGENPIANLRFMVFLAGVVQAVDDYQELLRMSAASAGNDHRLGANEAPPAIVSMFLGDELGRVVDALISGDDEYESAKRTEMDLGVDELPNFLKDNTDRNRTSPFAFTGNKFEFRMPGSQQNLSDCNIIRQHCHGEVAGSRSSQTRWKVSLPTSSRRRQGNTSSARCATTSASSSTATDTPTNGPSRPPAAALPTTRPLPTRCRASSLRSPSTCSGSSTC